MNLATVLLLSVAKMLPVASSKIFDGERSVAIGHVPVATVPSGSTFAITGTSVNGNLMQP